MRIDASELSAPHPVDIAEWEDLLVRLEIMPRALFAALDGVGDAAVEPLRRLVGEEAVANRWLEVVATGRQPEVREPAPLPEDARGLAERFASLRARSFAMVQRRGVQVWEWTGPLDDGGEATVFQLLAHLLRSDARTLQEVRATGRGPAGADGC